MDKKAKTMHGGYINQTFNSLRENCALVSLDAFQLLFDLLKTNYTFLLPTSH